MLCILIVWNLNICSITDKRDVSIHASKSTTYTLQDCEKVSKCHSCPEVHPHFTPVHSKGHPTAHSPYHLQGNLQQHAHYHMKSEIVRPFLPSHHSKICCKKICHQEPAWQLPNGYKKWVSCEFKVLQEGVQVICCLSIHPCLVERH